MLRVARVVIPRPASHCFQAFCDARRLPEWVPGLRRARLVVSGGDGLPREVLFQFGDKLTYSLLYAYSVEPLRVEWHPSLGRRDAVSGWAEFIARDGQCEMSYALEPTGDAGAAEARSDPTLLVEAFARWALSQAA